MDSISDAGTNTYSMFVGNLDPSISSSALEELFNSTYPASVHSAHIVFDHGNRNISKCYGFVRFRSKFDRQRAIQEMNGYRLGTRKMKLEVAAPKKTYNLKADQYWANSIPETDSNEERKKNTEIFLSNLDRSIDESDICAALQVFGTILQVRFAQNREIAFVMFKFHEDASASLKMLNRVLMIKSKPIKMDWCKSIQRRTPSSSVLSSSDSSSVSSWSSSAMSSRSSVSSWPEDEFVDQANLRYSSVLQSHQFLMSHEEI